MHFVDFHKKSPAQWNSTVITFEDVRYRKPVKFYIFMTSPKIKARK